MASKSLTAQNVSSAASILGIPMMATAFIQPAPGFVESGSDGSNEAWGGMISQGLEWLKDFGKTDSPIQGIDPTPMESASIDYGRTPDYYGTSSATTEASFTNWLDEFKKDDKRKFASTF